MIKAKICGVEVKAEFLNPDVREKYENCVEEVKESCEKATACKRLSSSIRMQCNAVIKCLNDMFGDDCAGEVLGETTDLVACLDAFEDFCDIYEKYVNPVVSDRAMAAKAKASLKAG